MSDAIETRDLGVSVYGTAQVDYTIDGTEGCSYDQAVAHVGLMRATATEDVLPAYTALVRLRQEKLEDLGTVLASISATLANFGSDAKTSDTKTMDNASKVHEILNKYGVGTKYFSGSATSITYENIQYLQSEVQYAIDVTDNDIDQDVTSLQSFVSKRDNAYELAQNLMQKACQTRAKGIKYIG